MGSIYKRKYKDKNGQIREGKIYWIKYYRNGKPYRESSESKKESDAKRLLKKREGEISQGKLPGIHFEKVRFDELAEGFLADYRINQKKKTTGKYRILSREILNKHARNIVTIQAQVHGKPCK
jgi:hypothetical protein